MIASVLWAIAVLNYNHVLENLRTMIDFNFINIFSDSVMGCSMEGASYYCFRKAVSNNFFQKVLLINFISTYSKLLKHFIFACFLLIEGYEQGALRKELIVAPFVERFKAGTLRKPS